MKILCKLTTQEITTHGGFKWEPGVTARTSGEGELCGPGWLHGYEHPLLAVLLNPIHANISAPRLWRIEVGGRIKDDCGLKFGATEMTLGEELPIPVVTPVQRVAFGILCALEVYQEPSFVTWAQRWLSGEDRSGAEAEAEAAAAAWAAWAAVWWDVEWAEWAAGTAAREAAVVIQPIDLIDLAEKAMTYE